MKKLPYFLLAMGTLFLFSCTEHWKYDLEDINYGFKSEIHEYSKEFILMKVKDQSTDIQLHGSIELHCGSVEIKVVSPEGNTIFKYRLTDRTQIELNETFPAQKGYWKLKYESDEGRGFINLQMNH